MRHESTAPHLRHGKTLNLIKTRLFVYYYRLRVCLCYGAHKYDRLNFSVRTHTATNAKYVFSISLSLLKQQRPDADSIASEMLKVDAEGSFQLQLIERVADPSIFAICRLIEGFR